MPTTLGSLKTVDNACAGMSGVSADVQHVLDVHSALVAFTDEVLVGSAWGGKYLVKNSEKT
jgi:type VI protein secretion system component VasF